MERDSTLTRGVKSVRGLYGRYGRWGKKLGAAITDQALFAGSNFLGNLLLARWMPKEEFGAVVVAFTWFLLMQTFYEALTSSPLSYYGAGKYSKNFRRYIAFITYGHLIMSVIISSTFGLAALLIYHFNSPLLGMAMGGAAISMLFMLARGLIRQPFYVLSKPELSARGGVIYLIVNLSSVFLLYKTGHLTPFSALMGIGFASFVTCVVQLRTLKPEFKRTEENAEITARQVIKDHWSYGKWSLSSQTLAWIAAYFGILFIPLVTGYTGSASLQVTLNLVQPIFQANAALVSLLVPTFVRTYRGKGKAGLQKSVIMVMRLVLGFTVTYFLLLTFFGKQVMHLLYNGQYDTSVSQALIMCVAALPVITTLSRVLDASFSGMGKVKLSFQSKIIPTTLAVILDIILVTAFGAIGYAVESLFTATLTFLILVYNYRRTGNTPVPIDKKPDPPMPTSDQPQQWRSLPYD